MAREAGSEARIGLVSLLLLAALLGPFEGAAQQVFTGQVVEEGSRRPVAAAFVTVADADGTRVVAGLTDGDGRFHLSARAAGGRYTLRAERLGYAGAEADPQYVDAGEVLEITLALPMAAVAVEGIDATGFQRCTLDADEGLRIHELWEEARKALEIAAWTEQEELFTFWGRRYERLSPVATGRVERETSRALEPGSRPPFFSRSIGELLEEGYVQPAPGEGAFDYFVPDAAAVLSEAFLDAYCFGLVERNPPGLVGLSFEPVQPHEASDVTGVLWLDEESVKLRHLELEYTDHPTRIGIPRWLLPAFGARVDFRELPNGAWIVQRWVLQMPEYQGRQLAVFQDWDPVRRVVQEMIEARSLKPDVRVPPATLIPERDRDVVPLLGMKEVGGELAAVEDDEGVELVTEDLAVLEGTVLDSTRMEALRGARVELAGTDYRVFVDRQGRFRMAEPTEGRFEVVVRHSRLDSLGVGSLTAEVELVRGEVRRLELAGPSRKTMYARACEPEPGRGVVGGRVVDRSIGRPVEGSSVQLVSDDPDAPPHAAWADREGVFVLCSVPADVEHRIVAEVYGVTREIDTIRLAAGEVREVDVGAPMSREGVMDGIVRGGESGTPLPAATIEIRGRARRTLTSDLDGRFHATDLPVGRYTVRVDHLGHRGVSREVTVEGGGRTVNVEVRLLAEAIAVDAITVEVEPRRPTAGPLADVNDRMDRMRRLGLGQSLDQRDLEESGATRMSHLLSRMSGVRARPIPGRAGLWLALNQNDCASSYYIDGLRVNVPTAEVDSFTIDEYLSVPIAAAVEVYRRSSELPGEFADANARRCGAVLIWTRRGG